MAASIEQELHSNRDPEIVSTKFVSTKLAVTPRSFEASSRDLTLQKSARAHA